MHLGLTSKEREVNLVSARLMAIVAEGTRAGSILREILSMVLPLHIRNTSLTVGAQQTVTVHAYSSQTGARVFPEVLSIQDYLKPEANTYDNPLMSRQFNLNIWWSNLATRTVNILKYLHIEPDMDYSIVWHKTHMKFQDKI